VVPTHANNFLRNKIQSLEFVRTGLESVLKLCLNMSLEMDNVQYNIGIKRREPFLTDTYSVMPGIMLHPNGHVLSNARHHAAPSSFVTKSDSLAIN
jgi:hypothetical protein